MVFSSLRNLWSIRNLIWLTSFWLLAFDAMVLIPVFVAQESAKRIFMLDDYAVFLAASFLLALLMVIELQIKRLRGGNAWKSSVLGGAGLLSTLVAAIFGSASCTLCLGILFNLLGFGTSFFLARNSLGFGLLAIVFLLFALIFSVRRFNTACEACRVEL